MKIAIIYPETLPSDKARTVTVVKTASSIGDISEATLICDSSSKDIKEITKHYGVNESFSVVKISKKILIKSNKIFNFLLLKHLRKVKYDVIYARHLKTAEALIKAGFDVIFEAHEIFADSAPSDKKEALAKVEKYVYENSKGIVFISETAEQKNTEATML